MTTTPPRSSSRFDEDADDVVRDYDQRAGIEPLITELKNSWGIGDATAYAFAANHALFLLKLRFAAHHTPRLRRCRTAWLQCALITDCLAGWSPPDVDTLVTADEPPTVWAFFGLLAVGLWRRRHERSNA